MFEVLFNMELGNTRERKWERCPTVNVQTSHLKVDEVDIFNTAYEVIGPNMAGRNNNF